MWWQASVRPEVLLVGSVSVRILVCSDLHLEYHADQGTGLLATLDTSVDALVVAGDLCSASMLEAVLGKLCSQYKHVVYVCGNHEHWQSSFIEVYRKLWDLGARYSNLHWLENHSVEVEGQRFIGATGWFKHTQAVDDNKHRMPDYTNIKGFEDLVYHKHRITLDYLKTQVKPTDVVLTHHIPTLNCVRPEFKQSKVQPFFVSGFDDVLTKHPKLWIFGHSHLGLDLTVDQTRMLSNPYGSVLKDVNPDFQPNLIVDL